jgi:malate dehydrogenase (oxaloacetate-decarboxylating)(NADP+)
VLWHVAPAVAQAATEEGIARRPLKDVEEYRQELRSRFEASFGVMQSVTLRARQKPKQIVFPQGPDSRVLRAVRRLVEEKIARPIILGREEEVRAAAADMHLDLDGVQVINPRRDDALRGRLVESLFSARQRKGMTHSDALEALNDPNMFAAMMVREGVADALLGGLTCYFPETIRPALQAMPLEKGCETVSATYIVLLKGRAWFLADCAVNIDPDAEALAEIALAAAQVARDVNAEPRVAFISHSNFGSVRGDEHRKCQKAIQLCLERAPGLKVDGEMHADTAVNARLLARRHPFNRLGDAANVLVFPNLTAANAAYKLLYNLGGGELIGPVLSGFSRSVHVLQRDAEVGDIVNLAALAVLDAQRKTPGPRAKEDRG